VFGQSKDELRQTIRQYVYEDKDYAPDILNWFRFKRICFRPALLADHAAYLRYMHEHTRHIQGRYASGDFGAVERADRQAEQRHALTGALMPGLNRFKVLHARMTAEIHITRAGLALLRHKQERGTWPETLDVLGIDNIDDPFARKALRYRPDEDGFVLYSVGEDRKDNGGVAKKPRQEEDFDIVWLFPNQPTR
jgi:hypothetical protein